MKYILFAFSLLFLVDLKAQKVNFEIGLVQEPITDSLYGIPYVISNPRQFRSVYKAVWEEKLGVTVVSKLLHNKYKVKFTGRDSTVKYKGKYFIKDGVLTSYKLRAKSITYNTDVAIFGVLANILEIKLQYFNSGYLGVIEWNHFEKSDGNYAFNLLLPAIQDFGEFSKDGLLLILPVVKKVPQVSTN
jgi:hypothetical protein